MDDKMVKISKSNLLFDDLLVFFVSLSLIHKARANRNLLEKDSFGLESRVSDYDIVFKQCKFADDFENNIIADSFEFRLIPKSEKFEENDGSISAYDFLFQKMISHAFISFFEKGRKHFEKRFRKKGSKWPIENCWAFARFVRNCLVHHDGKIIQAAIDGDYKWREWRRLKIKKEIDYKKINIFQKLGIADIVILMLDMKKELSGFVI